MFRFSPASFHSFCCALEFLLNFPLLSPVCSIISIYGLTQRFICFLCTSLSFCSICSATFGFFFSCLTSLFIFLFTLLSYSSSTFLIFFLLHVIFYIYIFYYFSVFLYLLCFFYLYLSSSLLILLFFVASDFTYRIPCCSSSFSCFLRHYFFFIHQLSPLSFISLDHCSLHINFLLFSGNDSSDFSPTSMYIPYACFKFLFFTSSFIRQAITCRCALPLNFSTK